MNRASGYVEAALALALATFTGAEPASAQPVVAPPPAESGPSAVLVREAVTEFNAGHWAEARALFARAYAEQPNARIARGLGLAAYELRHYVEAVRALQAALDDRRNPLTDAQRVEVSTALERARRYVGTVRIELVPEGAALLLDGRPVEGTDLTLDVGDYALTARAAGFKDARVTLNVEGGQSRSLRIELVPAVGPAAPGSAPVPAHADAGTANGGDPGFAQRVLGFTSLGLGAAGLVTGLVFELQRSDKLSDRDAICPTSMNCSLDDQANIERLTGEARTASTISLVGWIAGAAFAATGVVLLLTAESGAEARSVAVMPTVGRDGAGIALRVVGL